MPFAVAMPAIDSRRSPVRYQVNPPDVRFRRRPSTVPVLVEPADAFRMGGYQAPPVRLGRNTRG